MKRYIFFAVVSALLLPTTSAAKSKRVLSYSYQAIWSTAIRFIRVDRRYALTDKDKENGYVLFVFPGSGSVKKCPASLEMFETRNQTNDPVVRLQLNIAHQPSYVEIQFLDALERKLRRERGNPRPPPTPTPPAKPPKGDKKP